MNISAWIRQACWLRKVNQTISYLFFVAKWRSLKDESSHSQLGSSHYISQSTHLQISEKTTVACNSLIKPVTAWCHTIFQQPLVITCNERLKSYHTTPKKPELTEERRSRNDKTLPNLVVILTAFLLSRLINPMLDRGSAVMFSSGVTALQNQLLFSREASDLVQLLLMLRGLV